MRIVVVGTSGAGKTTLARRIAALLELPHIELDAVNWQLGWRDLTRHDPEEFVRRVNEAIVAEAWVVDGNYGPVRDRVWQRATHIVWLDYERPVIMARVIPARSSAPFSAPNCGPAIASVGGTCCDRATRSGGPGALGSAAAAQPRSAWRTGNAHIWRCSGENRADLGLSSGQQRII
jgi:energy-coupling factor transporter ATP-binding protein EcfA2